MAKRKKDVDEVIVDEVIATDQHAPASIGENKLLMYGIGLLALLVGGYFAYKYLVKEPKQKEAVEQMFMAQFQFDQDSFKLALTNPGGGYPGFVDIVEQYSGTPAGNLANYYAAVSYMHLGEFDAAQSYLKSFKAPDDVLRATKYGLLGDIASEKGEMDQALAYYQKAVKATDSKLVVPYYLKKLGFLYRKMGKNEQAREAFQRIKREYPNSLQGTDIDKYL